MKDLVDEGRVLNFKAMLNSYLGEESGKKNESNLDKYCDYGCYCVPLGKKESWVGAGEPANGFTAKSR